MDNKYDEYVLLSAKYCELLFSAAQEFFAANVIIEKIIADQMNPAPCLISDTSEHFSKSLSACAGAIKYLEYYRKAHEGYPSQLVEVNFNKQRERLELFIEKTKVSQKTISNLIDTLDLQQGIWDNFSITDAISSGATLISEAVLWQCSFAKDAHESHSEGR